MSLKNLAVLRTTDGFALVPIRSRPRRRCGPCRECCWRYPIPPIDKPKREPCPRFGETGCTSYDDRPKECSRYRCLWLMGFGGSSDRPDELGIIFDLPDEVQPAILVARMSRTSGELARPARARVLVSILERYGNVITFDVDTHPELGIELKAQTFGTGDDGMVQPRVCSAHHAWYRSAVASTNGNPTENLPPLLTPEMWSNAPGGIR